MGLLDQVLGQVLGGAGGMGGAAQSRPPQTGGGGLGGLAGALPGGLGGLLSGGKGPLALAILALLASKHLKGGAGGYGSVLHDMFTGGAGGGSATAGLPGDGGFSGNARPSGGSFLDQIGGMLGGQGGPGGAPPAGSGGGGFGGGLGGGLLGGMLGGGLGNLLNRFQESGQGGAMQSWIDHGPNQSISPDELETALGPEDIEELSRQTGMERGELLSGLSQALPQVVDRLTPDGRLPNEHEEGQWI